MLSIVVRAGEGAVQQEQLQFPVVTVAGSSSHGGGSLKQIESGGGGGTERLHQAPELGAMFTAKTKIYLLVAVDNAAYGKRASDHCHN